MEIVLALAAAAGLGWWLGRRRHRRRDLLEESAGFLVGGVPLVLSHEDAQRDLEEGALDPDELEDELVYWDEGADDEID